MSTIIKKIKVMTKKTISLNERITSLLYILLPYTFSLWIGYLYKVRPLDQENPSKCKQYKLSKLIWVDWDEHN